MNMSLPPDSQGALSASRFPLFNLLQPRQYTLFVIVSLAIGLVAGLVSVRYFNIPVWAATAIVLVALLPAGLVKWRDDGARFGLVVMLLSILLTAQGVHTIEHIVQWVQYNVLYLPARQSTGLLSPANAEWVHFVWNLLVLVVVLLLVKGGVRNVWAGLLLGIAIAHMVEHTYTFVRHLQVLDELRQLGVTNVTAQGLPGIIGRDGWLARGPLTQGTIFCSLPFFTTAIRLEVHFWWNVVEMALLALAAHVYLRRNATRRVPAE
jgi:hypothetical protein